MGFDADAQRRRELGSFLRARREALNPEDLVFAAGGRRRTPGLRREEVAAIADVSPSWYTWLEQGRDIKVSRKLLDRLATALKLNDIERRHLYVLAEGGSPQAEFVAAQGESIQRMLDALEHIPALVYDRSWTVVAANAMACRLLGYRPQEEGRHNNIVWRLFRDPNRRTLYLDWDTAARRCLMQFRTDYARFSADRRFTDLVAELSAASVEFREWWSLPYEVDYRDFARNFIAERAHPEVGVYAIEQTTLEVGGTGLRVTISTPLPERNSIARFKEYYAEVVLRDRSREPSSLPLETAS
jgi:PAS domain-containing protein